MKAFRLIVCAGWMVTAICPAFADTYALVHAIENSETIIQKGMSKEDCQRLKERLIRSGEIEVEGDEEDPSLGTLSCISESYL